MGNSEEIDYNMLDYFWNEKGCLECWGRWNEQRKLIKKKHPELIELYQDMKRAKSNFRRCLNEILEENK